MADEVKKRSNWVGNKNELEDYVIDLDHDVYNLYEEKTINLNYLKRYALSLLG